MDGARLAELREDKKLKQDDLADQVGISRASISLYETGNGNPSADAIIKLCKFFDVSADYLLGLTDLEISYRREKHIPLPRDCPDDLASQVKARMEELVEYELYKRKNKT